MKPTHEDIFVLAYFEAEDRKRRDVYTPGVLTQLAFRAPNHSGTPTTLLPPGIRTTLPGVSSRAWVRRIETSATDVL